MGLVSKLYTPSGIVDTGFTGTPEVEVTQESTKMCNKEGTGKGERDLKRFLCLGYLIYIHDIYLFINNTS